MIGFAPSNQRMAIMVLPSIKNIWLRLPLSDADFAFEIAAATSLAHSPHFSPLDCPWNYCTDGYSRACRVAWRVAFRIERERLERQRSNVPWKAEMKAAA